MWLLYSMAGASPFHGFKANRNWDVATLEPWLGFSIARSVATPSGSLIGFSEKNTVLHRKYEISHCILSGLGSSRMARIRVLASTHLFDTISLRARRYLYTNQTSTRGFFFFLYFFFLRLRPKLLHSYKSQVWYVFALLHSYLSCTKWTVGESKLTSSVQKKMSKVATSAPSLAATVGDVVMESSEGFWEAVGRKPDLLFNLLKASGLGFLFVKGLDVVLNSKTFDSLTRYVTNCSILTLSDQIIDPRNPHLRTPLKNLQSRRAKP